MNEYFRGSTPYLYCEVWSKAGALVDPATSITCTIEDPNGTLVAASATETMGKEGGATGKFFYAGYTVDSTALSGPYKWRPTVTDSSIVTVSFEDTFEVMDR